MIDDAVACTERLRPERLGLIGGRQTVLPVFIARLFKRMAFGFRQRIAQPLSGLIESGDVSSARFCGAECRRILEPLKNCSHILLACTHYPAILPLLREFVSRQTFFIDPAPALVNSLKKWNLRASKDEDLYLTTGDPVKMRSAAKAAFGWNISKAKRVRI